MPTPEHDPDALHAVVMSMGVRTVSITFAAKVTRKEYDDFRSFESSETWTLRRGDEEDVTPEVARLVALRYSPMLIAKVLTDLHLGGVVSIDETKQRIREMKDYYKRLYDAMLHGGTPNDQRSGEPDLPGIDRAMRDSRPIPGAGAAVSEGRADGVPAEAGPDLGAAGLGEP